MTNLTANKTTRVLWRTLLTEAQAIAIYQAECWALRRSLWTQDRKTSLQTCEKILAEELTHARRLEGFLPEENGFRKVEKLFSVAGGILLGLLMSLLPARLSWPLHRWAELQAEQIYRGALQQLALQQFVAQPGQPLFALLHEASSHEREHAELFWMLIRARSIARA